MKTWQIALGVLVTVGLMVVGIVYGQAETVAAAGNQRGPWDLVIAVLGGSAGTEAIRWFLGRGESAAKDQGDFRKDLMRQLRDMGRTLDAKSKRLEAVTKELGELRVEHAELRLDYERLMHSMKAKHP